MKHLIQNIIAWYTERQNRLAREEDKWAYKDGAVIDMNAKHWRTK